MRKSKYLYLLIVLTLIINIGFENQIVIANTVGLNNFQSGQILDQAPIFGPEKFVNDKIQKNIVRDFAVQNPDGKFTLIVQNGEGKRGSVSSAIIKVNGISICDTSDFNKNVDVIKKEVVLKRQNTLNVELRGKAETSLIVTVMGDKAEPTLKNGIRITPDAIFVKEKENIDIQASIPYDINKEIPEVKLVTLDNKDRVISEIGDLTDDGNIINGDRLKGDGVFSIRKEFYSNNEERIKFQLQIKINGSIKKSDFFYLDVIKHITNAEIKKIKKLQQDSKKEYNDKVKKQDKEIVKNEILNKISKDLDVKNAGKSKNGIWVLYKSGILGGINFEEKGFKSGEVSVDKIETKSEAEKTSKISKSNKILTSNILNMNVNKLEKNELFINDLKDTTNTLESDVLRIKNNKAIFLSPFNYYFEEYDDIPLIYNIISNSTNPVYDITYLKDTEVTVDTFKTLYKYGIVAISSHGDTYFKGVDPLLEEIWGWDGDDGQSVVYTKEVADEYSMQKYEMDLKRGRLAINTSNNDYYAILPSFIKYYATENYPDSLVYLSACRSAYNNTLANAFIEKGAKTFQGYTDYVNALFAQNCSTQFFGYFINPVNDVTTGEAFFPNQHDTSSPPAYYVQIGEENLVAPSGELSNGYFETNSLTAWTKEGDARIISQLGEFTPTEGDYCAIISNGLGYALDTGLIMQKFSFPANAKQIKFDWNFCSEEFMESVGTPYQDNFEVYLLTDAGRIDLFNRRVDELSGKVFHSILTFDFGDVWATGWYTNSIDISTIAASNANKSVALVFKVNDSIDTVSDTAVLLDNIKIITE